jgi:hypothetical protein
MSESDVARLARLTAELAAVQRRLAASPNDLTLQARERRLDGAVTAYQLRIRLAELRRTEYTLREWLSWRRRLHAARWN